MVLTHIWICGRWSWRFLTLKQWAAMPHIGKKLALIKAGKIGGSILCAGTIAIGIPPALDTFGPDAYAPLVGGAPINVPEPWSIAVLAVGVAGLVMVRR